MEVSIIFTASPWQIAPWRAQDRGTQKMSFSPPAAIGGNKMQSRGF
ncbi:hypothetical protein [Mesorhizobium sp. INR15]|nr:hypothetical protein [Mesorhizobium sp. INR15]